MEQFVVRLSLEVGVSSVSWAVSSADFGVERTRSNYQTPYSMRPSTSWTRIMPSRVPSREMGVEVESANGCPHLPQGLIALADHFNCSANDGFGCTHEFDCSN
jgi:hypothetical protein